MTSYGWYEDVFPYALANFSSGNTMISRCSDIMPRAPLGFQRGTQVVTKESVVLLANISQSLLTSRTIQAIDVDHAFQVIRLVL